MESYKIDSLLARLDELEIEVSRLVELFESAVPSQGSGVSAVDNSWVDRIRGTFKDDKTYRQAARFGKQWRAALNAGKPLPEIDSGVARANAKRPARARRKNSRR